MAVDTGVRIKTSKVFNAILRAFNAGKRRILLEGGQSSTKTYSALQSLILIAKEAECNLDITVTSETLPHLKQGAIKDFFNILQESPETCLHYNKTDHIYHHPGWEGGIQFLSADEMGKAQGPRRDILFINQGENINWEIARELDSRTRLFTIVDWNPTSQFWAHEYWLPDSENNAYDHSTYLDALAIGVISADFVAQNIEVYRDKDPNWWNIFGLGLVGKVEGLVYPKFEQVEKLPDGKVFYGLDFGYLVDPSVLVANVLIGDKLYSQQLIYEKGLTNDQIARKMDLLKVPRDALILADADEPKSIDEIAKFGFNIEPSVKGPGSVDYTHQKVNQTYQHWTKDSLECIKEQRNFRYIRDGQGNLTDRTAHQWSHGMSARRYAVAGQSMETGRRISSKSSIF